MPSFSFSLSSLFQNSFLRIFFSFVYEDKIYVKIYFIRHGVSNVLLDDDELRRRYSVLKVKEYKEPEKQDKILCTEFYFLMILSST